MHQASAPGEDPLPGAALHCRNLRRGCRVLHCMIRIGHWMAVGALPRSLRPCSAECGDRSVPRRRLVEHPDPPADRPMSTNPPPTIKPPTEPPKTPSDPMPDRTVRRPGDHGGSALATRWRPTRARCTPSTARPPATWLPVRRSGSRSARPRARRTAPAGSPSTQLHRGRAVGEPATAGPSRSGSARRGR